jgi:hypothetical protein
MRLGPVVAVALFAFSPTAAADSATLPELPDLPAAGSTLDALDRNNYRCEQRDGGLKCQRPGKAQDRVAGEQVAEIVLVYRRGTLARTVITFDEQHFHALAQQLSLSLGPAVQGEEALNAGMGGAFKNHYYTWRHDGRAWLLEQFFERIIRSGLWMMSDDEFDALMTERERRRVRGVRDL